MIENKLFDAEKVSSPKKLILPGVLAFLALISLRVHYAIGAGLETGTFLVDNLSKLANQFYFDSIADIFVFACIFMLMVYVSRKDEKLDIWTFVLSAVFAGFYIIASVCRDLGSFGFFLANIYQLCLSALLFVGLTALFYAVLRLIFLLMENAASHEEKPLKHPWRSAAIIIFLCWLPWLISTRFCP